MKKSQTLVIYGPTATGKTSLAIALAQKFNGEIISADSRQVYRSLDIGSGKVSFDAKVQKYQRYWIVDGIKIHGFDTIDPGQQFTVADFLKFANSSMIQIIELNKLPIVVGGTGFYIKALIDGIDSIGIPKDEKLRRQLEKLTIGRLYQKLLGLDKTRAKAMNESDRANPRRLIRAIEVATYKMFTSEESKPTPEVKTSYQLPTTNYSLVGLTAPNDFLYKKAESWLQERLSKGMIGEVKGLLEKGIDQKWLDNLGLEYRWLSRHLTGKLDYQIAFERLTGDYHSFIRRQKTWFKKFPNIKLFDISKPNWQEKIEVKI